jgi:hypothetical protein
MKYFFVSINFELNDQMHFSSFGLTFDHFPTLVEVKQRIISRHKAPDDLLIIGFSEFAEEDYNNFVYGHNKAR